MKFPFHYSAGAVALMLLGVLLIRLAAGVATWVDLGALVISATLAGVVSHLVVRQEVHEDLQTAARLKAELEATGRIDGAIEDIERLKAQVDRLKTMAELS
jgi:hypothetical protein